ncbi:MFS transporter [Rhodococcus sp. IEGM 1354]|uniref:MFS transporter n=1 Tax=Rhodococcus sp. IEGM 1354 TaxID=3047088 RepID=UPI0024B6A98E|nr:MFS transporter [Rhodococcus sp. IEGM 1354]MDI9930774.1 MFS transporter [Rhodococcus sp. IEGM 1354]
MSTPTSEASRTRTVDTSVVVAVLALTGIVVSLMQTLIIPLIPQLPALLHASAADTAWAVTATLLAGAVAVPVVGRLGDMFGKRLMLLISLALLIAGSITGALSESLIPLIIGRALQGLAAGVIPLGLSIIRDVLPREKVAGATATMGASLGVGGALGLPAAALIAQYADWHILFWISAGLGLVVAGLVVVTVPESELRTGGVFDAVGAVGLALALVALLLAISKGSVWGWSSSITLGLIALAVVSLCFWGWWELRTRQPLVDLRVSSRRQVLLTNLASVVFGFSMFAMALVFPQVLQMPTETGFGLGRSMLVTGLVMAPSGIVMMLIAPLSSRITTTRGPKTTLMIAAVVVAAGYIFGVVTMSSVWHLVAISCIIGAGIGMAYGAMPALIMGAVPPSESAAANGLNALMRSLGTSMASAVAGVILAQMTITLGSTELPAQEGFRVTMALAALGAIIALALAAFLPPFVTTASTVATGQGVKKNDPAPQHG